MGKKSLSKSTRPNRSVNSSRESRLVMTHKSGRPMLRLRRPKARPISQTDCRAKIQLSIMVRSLFEVHEFSPDIHIFALHAIQKMDFSGIEEKDKVFHKELAVAVFTFAVKVFGQSQYLVPQYFAYLFPGFNYQKKDEFVDFLRRTIRCINIWRIFSIKNHQ